LIVGALLGGAVALLAAGVLLVAEAAPRLAVPIIESS